MAAVNGVAPNVEIMLEQQGTRAKAWRWTLSLSLSPSPHLGGDWRGSSLLPSFLSIPPRAADKTLPNHLFLCRDNRVYRPFASYS